MSASIFDLACFESRQRMVKQIFRVQACFQGPQSCRTLHPEEPFYIHLIWREETGESALQGNPILINRFFQPFDPCGYFCNVLGINGGWFSSAMETENDMLVPVRKGRPNVICDPIPDPFSMVIVDDYR
jgi:hypothetical protein